MDFKTFLPDFNAIGKTDWGKPNLKVDTKDPIAIALLAGAALMLIFVFTPWATYTAFGVSASKYGLVTWYGLFGLICALAAVVGVLYKHTELAFCAAVLGVIFGLIGAVMVPSFTIALVEVPAERIKAAVATGRASVGHWGAYLYLVATVVTGVAAYLKITKK